MSNDIHILVVDDQPETLRAVSCLLRSHGYDVLEAETGAGCLQLAQEHKPHLILLDHVLPDMDGVEVCRQIKADPTLVSVFVVLRSALAMSALPTSSESPADGLEAGADDYIVQPISNRELVARVRTITQRVETQRAAEQRTRLYYTLVEQIPAIVYVSVLDEVGTTLYISPHIERLLGFTPEEWLADAELWIKQLHPDDRGRVLAEFARFRDIHEPLRCEYRMLARDGRVVWVYEDAVILPQEHGQPPLRQGILVDITARKQVEEELRRSEERYRNLVEFSLDPIVVYTKGRVVYANPATVKLAGASSVDEIIGRSMFEFIHPDYHQMAIARARMTTEELRQTPLAEQKFLRPDGSVVDAEVANLPITYQGEAAGMAVIHNISERKRAEERLRHTNRALRLLSRCSQLVVRSASEPELLQETCRLIVAEGGYRLAWVGFAGQNAEKTVRPVAHAGYDEGYLEEVKLTWADVGAGRGPVGTAIRTGQPAIARSILTEADFVWRAQALEHGYQSVVSLPLTSQEGVFGVLNLYATKPDAFDAEEVNLLKELADDLNFGIATQRQRLAYHQMVQDLRQSEQKFRTLAESSSVAIMIYQDDRWVYANPAAEKLAGFSYEDLLGSNYWDIVHPEHRELVRQRGQARQQGKAVTNHYMFKIVTKAGAERWVDVTVDPIDYEGRPAGMALLYDITEQKQREEEIRRLKEFNENIVQTMAEGIALEDVDGRFTFVNPAGAAMLGYVPEALLGKDAPSITPPDQRPIIQAASARRAHGERDRYQVDLMHKDGHRVPVLMAATPRFDPQTGAFAGTLAVFTDITQHKQAEEELEKYRRHLEELVEQRTTALQEAEGELRRSLGRTQLLNRVMATAVSRLEPYRVLEALCKELATELNLPQTSVALLGADQQSLTMVAEYCAEGRPSVMGAVIPAGGNSATGYVLEHREPLVLADAQTDSRLAAIHDLTKARGTVALLIVPLIIHDKVIGTLGLDSIEPREFTQDEIQLAQNVAAVASQALENSQLYAEVQRELAERKRAEEEARQARDAAEAANLAKSTFLANMSHEIRTPMNAILGYAQLMRRDPVLTPTQGEYLHIIDRSGEHLLALINDILEISKIEAGRVELHPTTFDLHALLDDLETMFRVRTDAKGLRLAVERIGQVPHVVHADVGKLRQVLINVIGNAVKFTDQGGVTVRVQAEKRVADAVRVVIEVEDTGVGIAPQEFDKVFDQFEQTESGRERGGGTGLGMPISRQYARMMGGDLTLVWSEVGKGSTFRLEFNTELGPVGEVKEAAVPARQVRHIAPGEKPQRILIVDDHDTNRDVLAQILEQVGFETQGAANGAEAIRIFEQWRPDVILMDVRMPGMDGREATRRIKATPQGAKTWIIVVSSGALEEEREQALAAGANGFIGKPFREEEIFEAIHRATGVEYIYQVEETRLEGPASAALTPESLRVLPEEVRIAMRAALEAGNMSRLTALIGQAADRAPAIAEALRHLADRYEYDALSRLLEGG